MANAKLAMGRFLSDSELNFLRFGLRLGSSPESQKRALQNLCEYYESGKLIADPSEIRQMIHSHLSSPETLVRRWALKALALIGSPDDFPRIIDRLKVEEDAEAQTWGITALAKNAEELGLQQLCEMAGLENTSAMALAARLYAPESWLAGHSDEIRISLSSDELTLKWATFLIGYDRAPVDLFHPKHSNEIFLGELNVHDVPHIREYSIWALWERKEFSSEHSRIPLSRIRDHPESVRKWLFRLASQSAGRVKLDAATFDDLRRDRSKKALEGLAQGVADLDPKIFGGKVLEWYTIEADQQVREFLLASMASRSVESEDYADVVLSEFRKEPQGSSVSRRVLAASVGKPLYQKLREYEEREQHQRQPSLISEQQPGTFIYVEGDLVLNNNTISAGRDINAQNLVAGDMINSANAAVQNLERVDDVTAKILGQVMSMLAATPIEEGKAAVAVAVEQLATAPSTENKKTLVDKIKEFGAGAAAAGSAIGGLDILIESVGNILV